MVEKFFRAAEKLYTARKNPQRGRKMEKFLLHGIFPQIIVDKRRRRCTDASRASYFLTNRLGGMVTKDGIRSKVLSTYTGNTLIGALESSYSLTDLPNYETLRKACCYAFADYLFDLAGDPNGTDPVDPNPDPEPDPEPDDAYYSVFSSDTTTSTCPAHSEATA